MELRYFVVIGMQSAREFCRPVSSLSQMPVRRQGQSPPEISMSKSMQRVGNITTPSPSNRVRMRKQSDGWERYFRDCLKVAGRLSRVLLILTFLAWSSQRLLGQSPAFLEAQEKYQKKESLAAMLAAQKAVQEDGNNPEYRHLYGSILMELKQFTEAEENLRKAVALDPSNADFHYSLGALLLQQKIEAAISLQLSSGVKRPRAWLVDPEGLKALEQAVALNPNHLKARLHLGRTYYDQNRHDLAMEQFEFVIRKDPRYPWVHSHIAVIYMNAGAVQEAVRELKTELELHPDHGSARLDLGEAFLKAGQPKLALEQFLSAEKQDPEMSEQATLHYGLGKAYRDLGQSEKAVDSLRRCTQLDPTFPDAHYLLGRLYQETGQSEFARQEMEKFQKLKPGLN